MEDPQQVARYAAVADQLKAQIGKLASNSLLPSEDQLARRFKVSRVTIRRALAVLEGSGLVDRQRGRGTIVNPPKVLRSLIPMVPIEDDLMQQGLKMTTEVLSVERRACVPDHVLDKLQRTRSDAISAITLLRSVDDRVISFDRRYISDSIVDDLDLSEIGTTPTWILFGRCARLPITEYKTEMEFVPSSQDEARILRVTPGTLLVVNTGTDHLQDGEPYCVTAMYYRIDRVRFSFVFGDSQMNNMPVKTNP
ncbi:GntR family transcriptional regulator [Bradyrhizobium sp. B097]|uniref:GntR family transcriptional regulator n=1 Tax=Bradyrhizobium sp. B097 TaxID=3140244 RepID=UPI003183E15B